MRKRIFGTFLATLVATFILSLSCETDEDRLAGTWTRVYDGRDCTLTITADHNWQAEFIDDGGIDVWGTYTLSGSQITILDTGGEYRSDSPGVYIFGVSESSLVITVVSDPEAGRSTVIEGVWLPL